MDSNIFSFEVYKILTKTFFCDAPTIKHFLLKLQV